MAEGRILRRNSRKSNMFMQINLDRWLDINI